MPVHVTRFNSFRDLSSFSGLFIMESLIDGIHFTQPLQSLVLTPVSSFKPIRIEASISPCLWIQLFCFCQYWFQNIS